MLNRVPEFFVASLGHDSGPLGSDRISSVPTELSAPTKPSGGTPRFAGIRGGLPRVATASWVCGRTLACNGPRRRVSYRAAERLRAAGPLTRTFGHMRAREADRLTSPWAVRYWGCYT